ncbi:hypothetical protein LGQ02_15495 [Bacillus shivajii]|uniref:hypothetical protein n=1 Tax=Bacillus shivajii TaxID=1983719 RepID=UPI001CFA2CE6|nr:hypothetical protein [Bacillus shivajii]UCZ52238.1 hypothetical protein LGQ02_15495 [Bacillus shivajii]
MQIIYFLTFISIGTLLSFTNQSFAEEPCIEQKVDEFYQLEAAAEETVDELLDSWEERSQNQSISFTDYMIMYRDFKKAERRIDEEFDKLIDKYTNQYEADERDDGLVQEIHQSYEDKKYEMFQKVKKYVKSL